MSVVQAVKGYNAKSNRIILVQLHEKPVNIITIQVYASSTDVDEEEFERFCASVLEEIEHTPKHNAKIQPKIQFLEHLKPMQRTNLHY